MPSKELIAKPAECGSLRPADNTNHRCAHMATVVHIHYQPQYDALGCSHTLARRYEGLGPWLSAWQCILGHSNHLCITTSSGHNLSSEICQRNFECIFGRHKMAEKDKETSQAERMAIVKFARYTAYTADKMASILMSLATQLEEAGVIKANRPSRAERDRKLRKQSNEAAKLDQEIAKMMRLIPEHPDAENLLRSLLGDLYRPPEPPISDQPARDDGREKEEAQTQGDSQAAL